MGRHEDYVWRRKEFAGPKGVLELHTNYSFNYVLAAILGRESGWRLGLLPVFSIFCSRSATLRTTNWRIVEYIYLCKILKSAVLAVYFIPLLVFYY